MERTLVLIKPDALQRALVGEIVARFERKGLKIVGMKMMRLADALLDVHYAHINHLPFFDQLKAYMGSAPVVAVCLAGVDVVETVRRMCGPTKGSEAPPGTIRGDFSMAMQYNVIHASDSVDMARREIARFFHEDELFEYDMAALRFIYADREIPKDD